MAMNKLFRKWVLVSSLLVLGCVAAQAQTRIATVELTRIFENFWKTKQAKLALNDTRADLKKELDEMNDLHKKLIQQYQKMLGEANDQAVSSEEREKRRKALEAKVKAIKEDEDNLKAFVNRSDAELERKTQRMMEDVIKDIRAAVASKAKSAGYAYVFDASADSMSRAKVLLYNSGEADLTDEVIKDLSLTAPPDVSAPSEKPAEKKDKK
jgi:outer membrane protein